MEEKIEKIRIILMQNLYVRLYKKCANEYILYTFYINNKRDTIIHRRKSYYSDNEFINFRKSKSDNIEIYILKFLDDVVVDLLNRGYELVEW